MLEDKQKIEQMIKDKINSGKKKFGADFEFFAFELLGLHKMLMPEPEEKEREIPLSEWNKYHADPSVPALRMMWARREENGFEEVVEKRGKRLLIKEQTYFRWRKERAAKCAI